MFMAASAGQAPGDSLQAARVLPQQMAWMMAHHLLDDVSCAARGALSEVR